MIPFAWFQAQASVSGSTQGNVQAAIGVTEDVSVTTSGLNLVVHLKAVPKDDAAPILSAWAEQKGASAPYTYEINADDTKNTTIVKGNRDVGGGITLAAMGSETWFKLFDLKAWATSDELGTNLTTVKAAMAAAANAGAKATFYINYDSGFTYDDGNAGTTDHTLTAAEMNYFTSSSDISTYAKASEADGTANNVDKHKIEVTVASLLSGGDLVAEGSAIDVGDLAVRVDGSKGNHVNGDKYGARLNATSTGTFTLTI